MGEWRGCIGFGKEKDSENIWETTGYCYDENGNLIQKQVYDAGDLSDDITYQYDAFNRLIAVEGNDLTATYTYDANNMRTGKTVNGVKTNQIWDGINITAQTDSIGNVTDVYTRGVGLISQKANGIVSYYIQNGHGDVTALIDENGEIIKDYEYNAFGVETVSEIEDTNPFRYCGEYWDSESELTYLRNRYYDSSIGRFISEDPVRDGLNWYSYAINNPVKFIDPLGLWLEGDENLSQEAQMYIRHYTEEWEMADKAYKNAITDAERQVAKSDMDFCSAAAGDIRYLDSQGRVTGTIHNVQVFRQGNLNLCWAYSQVMVEDYQNGSGMTQSQADRRYKYTNI